MAACNSFTTSASYSVYPDFDSSEDKDFHILPQFLPHNLFLQRIYQFILHIRRTVQHYVIIWINWGGSSRLGHNSY
jgi:hypothetical protein